MGVYRLGDVDEFFERERSARQEADSRVQLWQAQIKKGDYFKRQHPSGIHIYGKILDSSDEELSKDADLTHYRFCKAYSEACVSGELGDIHVSEIDKLITEAEFTAAQKRGWR